MVPTATTRLVSPARFLDSDLDTINPLDRMESAVPDIVASRPGQLAGTKTYMIVVQHAEGLEPSYKRLERSRSWLEGGDADQAKSRPYHAAQKTERSPFDLDDDEGAMNAAPKPGKRGHPMDIASKITRCR